MDMLARSGTKLPIGVRLSLPCAPFHSGSQPAGCSARPSHDGIAALEIVGLERGRQPDASLKMVPELAPLRATPSKRVDERKAFPADKVKRASRQNAKVVIFCGNR